MNDLFETTKPKKLMKMDSYDIRTAMDKRWSSPEWAIFWEVNESTGMNAGRSADAVMMSLWPSRGLELHGVEIKVSRSDWKREAADPSKAEAVGRYCDRWWIHTQTGLIQDLSEMPPNWGLREWSGKKWRTIKEAEKNEPEPINRRFLAALLRRSDNLLKQMVREATEAGRVALNEERERLHRSIDEQVERKASMLNRDSEKIKKQLSDFKEAFGIEVTGHRPDMKALGQAAKALLDAAKPEWNIRLRSQRLREAADTLDALDTLVDVKEAS